MLWNLCIYGLLACGIAYLAWSFKSTPAPRLDQDENDIW